MGVRYQVIPPTPQTALTALEKLTVGGKGSQYQACYSTMPHHHPSTCSECNTTLTSRAKYVFGTSLNYSLIFIARVSSLACAGVSSISLLAFLPSQTQYRLWRFFPSHSQNVREGFSSSGRRPKAQPGRPCCRRRWRSCPQWLL